MDKSMKIIAGVLLLVSVGYFIYTSTLNEEGEDNVESNSAAKQKTEEFIERRIILGSVKLDTSIFNDPVFDSYRSFSGEPVEFEFGRENPFRKIFADDETES